MGGIGVIRRISLISCGFDSGPSFPVMLCQTVGGAFRRSCFQIVKIAVLLLIVGKAFPHMVQHFLGKILRMFAGHILTQPVRIQADLVHSDEADG